MPWPAESKGDRAAWHSCQPRLWPETPFTRRLPWGGSGQAAGQEGPPAQAPVLPTAGCGQGLCSPPHPHLSAGVLGPKVRLVSQRVLGGVHVSVCVCKPTHVRIHRRVAGGAALLPSTHVQVASARVVILSGFWFVSSVVPSVVPSMVPSVVSGEAAANQNSSKALLASERTGRGKPVAGPRPMFEKRRVSGYGETLSWGGDREKGRVDAQAQAREGSFPAASGDLVCVGFLCQLVLPGCRARGNPRAVLHLGVCVCVCVCPSRSPGTQLTGPTYSPGSFATLRLPAQPGTES